MTAEIYRAFSDALLQFVATNAELAGIQDWYTYFFSTGASSIAWPGVPFTPPDTGSWVEVRPIFSSSRNYGLGASGPTAITGSIRVLANCRPGRGVVLAMEVAEQIVAAFPKGTRFGPALVFEAGSVSGPIDSDERVIVPATIRWQATRNQITTGVHP